MKIIKKGLKRTYAGIVLNEAVKQYEERFEKLYEELKAKRIIKLDKKLHKIKLTAENEKTEQISPESQKSTENIGHRLHDLDDTFVLENARGGIEPTNIVKNVAITDTGSPRGIMNSKGKLWDIIKKQEQKVLTRSMQNNSNADEDNIEIENNSDEEIENFPIKHNIPSASHAMQASRVMPRMPGKPKLGNSITKNYYTHKPVV